MIDNNTMSKDLCTFISKNIVICLRKLRFIASTGYASKAMMCDCESMTETKQGTAPTAQLKHNHI